MNGSWGSVLDANGDGLADVLIGTNYGNRAHLYLGTTTGPSDSPSVSLLPGAPSGSFGSSVANAGDVNGDGFGDILVTAPGSNATYVYLGRATGPASLPSNTLTERVGVGTFGTSLASAGDVNHDGYGDIVVGASNANNAFVYLGGPGGLNPRPATSLAGPSFANFSPSVAGVGDVNGDGYADIAIGADSNVGGFINSVFIYHGSPAGIGTTASRQVVGEPETSFGSSVNGAGDVNGDGYTDLIVGAHRANFYGGAAYLYLGSSSGIRSSASSVLTLTGAFELGYSVSSAGDVNGDGYSDVLVGSAGSAFVFIGTSSGLDSRPATALVGVSGSGFGRAVGGVDDMNGDGFSDVAVGSWAENSENGAVRIYPGSAAGTRTTPWPTIRPPSGFRYFGWALSRAP